MAKIDDVIDQISNCYKNPSVSISTVLIEDQYMEQIQVRRKGQNEQHKMFVLSVGETGTSPAQFYGYRISDCIKKALAWRGMPTKTKRGPRKNVPAQAQG
jgi:hypothetical protein